MDNTNENHYIDNNFCKLRKTTAITTIGLTCLGIYKTLKGRYRYIPLIPTVGLTLLANSVANYFNAQFNNFQDRFDFNQQQAKELLDVYTAVTKHQVKQSTLKKYGEYYRVASDDDIYNFEEFNGNDYLFYYFPKLLDLFIVIYSYHPKTQKLVLKSDLLNEDDKLLFNPIPNDRFPNEHMEHFINEYDGTFNYNGKILKAHYWNYRFPKYDIEIVRTSPE